MITERDFEFLRGMMRPGDIQTVDTASGRKLQIIAKDGGAYIGLESKCFVRPPTRPKLRGC